MTILKNYILLIFITSLTLSTFSQNTFEKLYNKPAEVVGGIGTLVMADSSGYYLGGSAWINGGNKPVLIRTDLNGDTLWMRFYPNQYGNVQLMDNANPGQFVFLNNPSNLVTKSDVKVTKMDNAGNIIWSNTIVKHNWDEPNQLIQTNDKGYLIVGHSNSLPGITVPYPYDAYVIKLNVAGDTLWTRTIGVVNNNDYAFEAIESTDSHFFITGYESHGKMMLIKMDAAGNVLWTKKYANNYINQPNCIARTKDNCCIVAGTRNPGSSNESHFYAMKIDAEGNVLWEKTYLLDGKNYRPKLLMLESGFLIAGQNLDDIFLLKADEEGSLIWSKVLYTKQANTVSSVVACTDSGFLLTSTYSFTLIKTDPNGCVKPELLSVTGEHNVSVLEAITFSVKDQRGETYSWVSSRGTVLAGQGTSCVSMKWDKTGTDTIKLLVRNDCGMDSTQKIVNILDCAPVKISQIQQTGFFDFHVEKIEGESPTYLWQVDQGTILSGQNTEHIVVDWNSFGQLKVSVKVSNDCSLVADSISFFYDQLKDVENEMFQVFPNPARDGIFQISNKHNTEVLIQIYNGLGQLIELSNLEGLETKQFDISSGGRGVFLLKITTDKSVITKKILNK